MEIIPYMSIFYFKGLPAKFLKYDVFLYLKIVFILANSEDPDEMPICSIYLGIYCLPEYLLIGIQNEEGWSLAGHQDFCAFHWNGSFKYPS